MSSSIRGAAVAALAWSAVGGAAYSQVAQAQPEIRLSTIPEQVCLDTRPTPHLNFDLVIRNATAAELKVKELRAFVLDRQGEAVERRIVWADALNLVAPNRSVKAGEEGLIYNPFAFNTVKQGRRIRYEVDFEGRSGPATVVVEPRSCVTRARLVLPIAGRVAVLDGHDFLSHHRRMAFYRHPRLQEFGVVDNFGRFGLDLLHADKAGAVFRGDGRRNEDWFGWQQPVRAAGDGVVAAVHDGQPDNDQPFSENRWTPKRISEDEMDASGNYVLIDHGAGEFSLTAHARQGSVKVRKGDRVKAGQVIAQVGNSGSSLMPHVHYELRTGWGVRGVRNLPAYFHDLKVLGSRETGAIAVNTGDIVLAR
jgi:hypothetical protein